MPRILLLEPSPTLRRGLEKLLCRQGFEVVSAADGAAATALLNPPQDWAGAILGWSPARTPALDALLLRLAARDCETLGLLILAQETERVDERLLNERPFTLIERWERYRDVPRLMRGLLAYIRRETRSRESAETGLRVLLVDDSRTIRLNYQKLLEAHGYAVVAVEDAEAALAAVAGDSFDLAIIDYFMPGMNGAMLCRALRERAETRELTLAILTGSYQERVINDCLAAGAAECMFKTESRELFLARVHGLARGRLRERRLEAERTRLNRILASVGDGVYGVDGEGRIRFVNPAALRLLAWSHESELVGRLAHECFHPADERGRPVPLDTCFLHQAYELGDSLRDWETQFWRADGTALSVECTLEPLRQDGEPVGAVVAFRDISERKLIEREREWQVRHDHLTQLLNRGAFDEALSQEVMRLKRSEEASALLFIDLDRFKQINDSAGHAAGDALLVAIAQKLMSRQRRSDVLARLGGDEFAVLLRHVDSGQVAGLAEQFRAILDETRFAFAGREFDVSGSVGVTRLDRYTRSTALAMDYADAACQIAKRKGRNQVHLFNAHDDAEHLAMLEQSWSARLGGALASDAFALQFQPIRRLEGGAALYGYEVFLRLDDMAEPVTPRAFLSQAERFELLPALDAWVLDCLAGQLREAAAAGLRFHVNVASASLADPAYRVKLRRYLDQGVFAPGQLCLELRDSELVAPLTAQLGALQELAEAGLSFVLDEFGRSGAQAASLKLLPFKAVKLDGALVQNLGQDPVADILLRAMTEVAHALGRPVLAPLVEDEVLLAPLRAAGVDWVQGYALGRPQAQWLAGMVPSC
ncbi:MAG: EAL domain-containing protein [Gammaproteobacteria bacterium]|nr:EAL domain-containing protein [Gammaproteobacteria bacterium]